MFAVTRWSLRAGDIAYVDAATDVDAIEALASVLSARGQFLDAPCLSAWHAVPYQPSVVIVYEDRRNQ